MTKSATTQALHFDKQALCAANKSCRSTERGPFRFWQRSIRNRHGIGTGGEAGRMRAQHFACTRLSFDARIGLFWNERSGAYSRSSAGNRRPVRTPRCSSRSSADREMAAISNDITDLLDALNFDEIASRRSLTAH